MKNEKRVVFPLRFLHGYTPPCDKWGPSSNSQSEHGLETAFRLAFKMAGVLHDFEPLIRQLVEIDRLSYKEVEHILKSEYQLTRGCSVRSIENFCASQGIHRHHGHSLSNAETDGIVAAAIDEVRKWVKSWLYPSLGSSNYGLWPVLPYVRFLTGRVQSQSSY